ncbi:MAG: 2-C-methyl-D-erythritol 4-phosphate cytidylyltransferase [Fluviibacter sp.]
MSSQYFAIIPAAGSGSRFGAPLPKQYLTINGLPIIRHAIDALLADARIARVVVVLSPEDNDWHEGCLPAQSQDRVSVIRIGGVTRAESVLNGISWLANNSNVKSKDWILVHDAARPCLTPVQIDALITSLSDDPVGGLLAIPVADTVKRADTAQRVEATLDRRSLWQAQTPQMFRLDLLQQALGAIDLAVATDESAAIEALGYAPKLVAGSLANLKVTYPADLSLATAIINGNARNH